CAFLDFLDFFFLAGARRAFISTHSWLMRRRMLICCSLLSSELPRSFFSDRIRVRSSRALEISGVRRGLVRNGQRSIVFLCIYFCEPNIVYSGFRTRTKELF